MEELAYFKKTTSSFEGAGLGNIISGFRDYLACIGRFLGNKSSSCPIHKIFIGGLFPCLGTDPEFPFQKLDDQNR